MVISAFSEVKTPDLSRIFNILLHEGITKYKKKHSNSSLPIRIDAEKKDQIHKKGTVFVVRDKSHFTANGVRGYIVTSKETLLEDANGLTHFTPNVYRKYGYADESRKYINGFEERNLLQVNTFVVDIDTKKHTQQDIFLACMDHSVGIPTLILESDRGYQVYFALSSPMYISNKNNFRSLKVAKRISENIKNSLKSVDSDVFCNDFGFFRIPNIHNIVWFDENALFDPTQLINWSMQQDDNKDRELFVVHSNMNRNRSVMSSEWMNALINARHIRGNKGQIGRNNTLFTLALIFMQQGIEKEKAFDLLDEFNSNLDVSLANSDVRISLDSAYSGKYKGAKKEYIQEIFELYVPNSNDYKISFGNGWHKHKKDRSDRVRSHLQEWESDILNYLNKANKDDSQPFVWYTQKQLCEAVGVPQSTLNKVMNKTTKILKTVTGKGRSAITGWTTVSLFISHAIRAIQESRSEYNSYKLSILNEWLDELDQVGGYKIVCDKLYDLLSPNKREIIQDNTG